jgi:hypothetical protein
MGVLAQVGVVLWKNYLLKSRRYISTLIEIAIPLVLFMLLVWVRQRHPPVNVPTGMPALRGGVLIFIFYFSSSSSSSSFSDAPSHVQVAGAALGWPCSHGAVADLRRHLGRPRDNQSAAAACQHHGQRWPDSAASDEACE